MRPISSASVSRRYFTPGPVPDADELRKALDGDPALLWHAGVAVVGSRSPTAGGRDNARAFARAFALSGNAVVSGMASGIDAAAHNAALEIQNKQKK